MTFAIGHVAGGTNAGRRRIKPAPRPWIHLCRDAPLGGGTMLAAAYKRCPSCGWKRP